MLTLLHTSPFLATARFLLTLAVLAATPVGGGVEQGRQHAGAGLSQVELEAHIDRLIDQLGSPCYAARQRAQSELKRLRMEAFDALTDAQFHDDIEIALSAQYLVRSMQVNWCTDEDPAEVKRLLQGYGSRDEGERRKVMAQLAELGPETSFWPLCRLVRYEGSEQLSKQAALLALSLEPPADESARRQFASDLLTRMGTSRRSSAEWLRAYAEMLVNDPDYQQRWKQLIAAEQNQLAENPDEIGRQIVRDLTRWYADQLSRREQRQAALAMMLTTIDLLSAKYEEILEAADWFRARGRWEVIVELADHFAETFQRHPILLYRLALAHRELDQDEKAEQAAAVALKAVPDELEQHRRIAENLQHDGLFEWAEYEYRHIMSQPDEQPVAALQARFFLSEMLHDIGREQAAGEVLRGLVELMESKEKLRELVETDFGRKMSSIKSRMYFFFARHHAQLKDHEQQRTWLLNGYQADPHDADVLIAMYRMPDADPAWREKARQRVREAADSFRKELRELERRWDASDGRDKALAQFQLARANNQLAWLIANTEGDFDESLRCSQASLDLRPDRPAGFLDTLGRCYYAKGDYENAVKYQAQAAALEPHSRLIAKQLELFQEALRQQRKSEADASRESKTKTKTNTD